jgi:hypothetical protein
METSVFWNTTPRSAVKVNRCFGEYTVSIFRAMQETSMKQAVCWKLYKQKYLHVAECFPKSQ